MEESSPDSNGDDRSIEEMLDEVLLITQGIVAEPFSSGSNRQLHDACLKVQCLITRLKNLQSLLRDLAEGITMTSTIGIPGSIHHSKLIEVAQRGWRFAGPNKSKLKKGGVVKKIAEKGRDVERRRILEAEMQRREELLERITNWINISGSEMVSLLSSVRNTLPLPPSLDRSLLILGKIILTQDSLKHMMDLIAQTLNNYDVRCAVDLDKLHAILEKEHSIRQFNVSVLLAEEGVSPSLNRIIDCICCTDRVDTSRILEHVGDNGVPLDVLHLLEREPPKQEERCSICFEDVTNKGERICILPKCRHRFHTECIIPWLATQSRCPLCNMRVCQ